MVIMIIPPDEAKKRIKANVAAWKREKAIRAAKGRIGPEKTEPAAAKAEYSEKKKALNEQLIESANGWDIERVRELLEKGADVNARNNHGDTPLILVAATGFKGPIVRLLLEKGADVHAKNNFGQTALIVSYRNNCSETIELLRKYIDNG